MEYTGLISFDFGVDIDIPDDLEVDAFINEQKAKATKNKNKTDLNTFNKFRKDNGLGLKPIEKLSAKELNHVLCQFFMKALTRKGKLYEPDTLSGIRNSLQRVLTERGSKLNLSDGWTRICEMQRGTKCQKKAVDEMWERKWSKCC